MASVTPRKNRDGSVSWRVQFRIDGKMRQETFPAEDGARGFGDQVDRVGPAAALAVLRSRQNRDVGVPTLTQFVDTYLDPTSGLLTGIEKGTRAGYRSIADRSFLPILGPIPIDAITKTDIGRWIAWQEEQPSARSGSTGKVAAKTVKNYHSLLSAILQTAVEQGLAPSNPAFKARISAGPRRVGVFLSASEFWTLMHFIPDYYRPLVAFLAMTGCRWGEATAVTWGHVDLNARIPSVRIEQAWKKGPDGKPVLGTPKSKKSRRVVPLPDELVYVLGKPKAGDEFMFSGMNSGKQIWYGPFNTRIWKTAVAKANDPELCAAAGLTPLGKNPNIHDLRHSYASWLIASGIDLLTVQDYMGHESVTTTSAVYGHLSPGAPKEVKRALSAVLFGEGHALPGYSTEPQMVEA
jgi:integrase